MDLRKFADSLDNEEIDSLLTILRNKRNGNHLIRLKELGYSLSAQEKTLVKEYRTVDAIKMARARLAISLCEAKILCDSYRDEGITNG